MKITDINESLSDAQNVWLDTYILSRINNVAQPLRAELAALRESSEKKLVDANAAGAAAQATLVASLREQLNVANTAAEESAKAFADYKGFAEDRLAQVNAVLASDRSLEEKFAILLKTKQELETPVLLRKKAELQAKAADLLDQAEKLTLPA